MFTVYEMKDGETVEEETSYSTLAEASIEANKLTSACYNSISPIAFAVIDDHGKQYSTAERDEAELLAESYSCMECNELPKSQKAREEMLCSSCSNEG